ncbi:hypothetical protein D3C85_527910 [compost metagenome]
MNFLRRLWNRITERDKSDTIFIRDGYITRRTVINGKEEVTSRQMTDKDHITFDESFAAMNKIHEKMMNAFKEG